MTKTQHYSLSEVAKLLKKQAYQVTYAIVTGQIPEPEFRFAGKRLFSETDLERLRSHFEVKNQDKENHEI